MKGIWVLAVAVAVTALALSIPAGAAQADGCPPVGPSGDGGEGTPVGPGERLAGVVGVQQSEVEGELDGRGFRARLANATSNASRADVVATEVVRIETRLIDLEEQCGDLTSALDDGNISQGTYQTRMATLEVNVGTLACHLNQTEAAATQLPDDLRDEHAINESVFDALDEQADDLAGFASEEAGEMSKEDAQQCPETRADTGDGVTTDDDTTDGSTVIDGTDTDSTPTETTTTDEPTGTTTTETTTEDNDTDDDGSDGSDGPFGGDDPGIFG